TKRINCRIRSYNAGITYIIKPQSITSQLWINSGYQKDDNRSKTDKIDRNEFNANLDFGIRMKQNIDWHIAGIYNSSKDNILPANTVEETGFNTKIIFGF
ncbi:MAG: hypothetical protein L0Y76_03175, partial [Ignavibacteria bacterium]|nr:hypothetical protein [Ignavibacteria bacterium]